MTRYKMDIWMWRVAQDGVETGARVWLWSANESKMSWLIFASEHCFFATSKGTLVCVPLLSRPFECSFTTHWRIYWEHISWRKQKQKTSVFIPWLHTKEIDACVTLKNAIHICCIMKMVVLLHPFMNVFNMEICLHSVQTWGWGQSSSQSAFK